MIQVYTNGGDTVLYTDKIHYETEQVVVEDSDPVIIIFVKFVPKNGPGRGLTTRMPINQISSIVEDDVVTAETRKAIDLAIQVSDFRDRIESGELDEYLQQLYNSVFYRKNKLGQS